MMHARLHLRQPSGKMSFAAVWLVGFSALLVISVYSNGAASPPAPRTVSGLYEWVQFQDPIRPQPLSVHTMTYDSVRGRVVSFGGIGETRSTETWEFDGERWEQVVTANAPSFRTGQSMAYDSARGRVVLYGGWDASLGFPSGIFQDTWEYDGQNWQQIVTQDSPNAPAPCAMVFDSQRGRMVLYGGRQLAGFASDETWEYDGQNWRILEIPAGSRPPGMEHPVMVYDSARDRVVLFRDRQTWEYNGTVWERRIPRASPSAIGGHGMAYDSVRQRTVLFGGYEGGDETWEWDGENWEQVDVNTGPSFRFHFGIAYHVQRQRTIVFGGDTAYGLSDETWEWNGAKWELAPAVLTVRPYRDHAMVFDEAMDRVLLFGGAAPTDLADNRSWEFDGTRWDRLWPDVYPSHRYEHTMYYDAAQQKVILFGGYNGTNTNAQTWERKNGVWRGLATTGSPSSRSLHAMAYDPARERGVMFGGIDGPTTNNETWEFDAFDWGTWRLVQTASSPSSRYGHAMAHDNRRGRTVLFGGSSGGDETWEYNGVDWMRIHPANAPTFRRGHAMVYDSAYGNVLLFGGTSGGDETWLYDGSNWTQLDTVRSPAARTGHAMIYDNKRKRTILYGGTAGGSETWILSYVGPDDPLPTPTPVSSPTPTPIPSATPTPGATPTVTPIPMADGSLLTLDAAHWNAVSFGEIFTPPVFEDRADGLLIATTDTGTFGYWETVTIIGLMVPGVYTLRASVQPVGDLEPGQRYPELRLRVVSPDGLVNLMRADASSQNRTAARILTVPFEITPTGYYSFRVAIDILRFEPEERGGYLITGMEILPVN